MDVKNFTLAEFVASDKAKALGIDNSLPDALEPAAWSTLAMLQRIRDELSCLAGRDVSVVISSGYRCPKLNTAVGSGSGSDHLRACAADIKAPAFGTPLEICRTLAPLVSTLGIGQLIYERPHGTAKAWVHVSTRVPAKAFNRIITVTDRGVVTGVVA